MQDVQRKEAMPVEPEQPACLLKRIGSTTFVVNIHFSKTSKETLEDKLLRLAGKEAY